MNDETIVVAFVAGVAGMLAFETRASSAIGVAISVTTIPAAAYLGVALGLGDLSKSLRALGVLSANVAMMVVGASATLWVQRRVEPTEYHPFEVMSQRPIADGLRVECQPLATFRVL